MVFGRHMAEEDAAWAAGLMENRRAEYEGYSPVFWRPRHGIGQLRVFIRTPINGGAGSVPLWQATNRQRRTSQPRSLQSETTCRLFQVVHLGLPNQHHTEPWSRLDWDFNRLRRQPGNARRKKRIQSTGHRLRGKRSRVAMLVVDRRRLRGLTGRL